ncbi:hypothetical protein ACPCTO_30095 [Streptomyces olivoreticuli]
MTNDYPFADGKNLAWDLAGFGTDDWLKVSIPLTREQIIDVRHLFDLGDDKWMMGGEYPVTPDIWGPMHAVLGSIDFQEGLEYFLGARQDLPDGQFWRPSPDTDPLPGPIPPP